MPSVFWFVFGLFIWAVVLGGWAVVIAGGWGVLEKLYYMRDDSGSLTKGYKGRRGGSYAGATSGGGSGGGSSHSRNEGSPGEKFGYTIYANCLPYEQECYHKDPSVLTDNLGNGHTMGDVHRELQYFIAFPIVEVVFFFVVGGYLQFYAYGKASTYMGQDKDTYEKTSTPKKSLDVDRFRVWCLGAFYFILLVIMVETILRFYYLTVRNYWVGANYYALYNNAIQVGVEWSVAILSMLFLFMPLLTLISAKRIQEPKGYVFQDLREDHRYRTLCFPLIPFGLI